MTDTTTGISTDLFRTALADSLKETFEKVQGIFLDKGDSIFETLSNVSAAQASQPLGPRSGNIASKVNHMCVYIEAVSASGAAGEYLPVDWEGSWKVDAVSDDEWVALVERLRTAYAGLKAFIPAHDNWNEMFVGGAFGLVAHNAYHLGEIRQALAVIAPDAGT